jgi:hypothetical protein
VRPVAFLVRVLVLASGGCAAARREVQARQAETLLSRAAFDVNCPANRLSWTCLQHPPDAPYRCVSAGVTGCGHRFTYVLSEPSGVEQWVLNASDGGPPRPSR